MSRVARAVAIGVIVGVVLGLREGLSTLSGNAYARSGEFGWAYLLAPVAVWTLLGPTIALLTDFGFALFARRPSAATLAAACTATGMLVWLVQEAEEAVRQMHAMGVMPGPGLLAAVGAVVVALAAATALAAGAAAARVSHTLAVTLGAIAVATSAAAFASAGATLGRFARVDAGRPPAGAALPPRADAPHILLISIDTLRADALGSYGSGRDTTPALDALAATGVTFRTAISSSSWTLPSVASLMTGLNPRRHGAGWPTNRRDPLGRSPMRPDLWTLASSFAAHGYETRAVVTNPYLLPPSGVATGFAHYQNLTFASEIMLAGRGNAGQWLVNRLAPHLVAGDRGSEVTRRAIDWIAAPHDRPFLLWLHYIDAHGPYAADVTTSHKTFRTESMLGLQAGTPHDEMLSPPPARLRSGEIQPDEGQREAIRELYRAEVARVDREIGRVMAALDQAGLRERTIVVCIADHGEEFWEHGGVEHGHSAYEEVVRVPFILSWPGRLPAGRVVDALVRTIDVAPTLVELAQLEPPSDIDGASTVPLIHGATDDRAALIESMLFVTERISVRTAGQKLVRWENGREEVYDLEHDPRELRNLAHDDARAVALRSQMDALEAPTEGAAILAAPRDDRQLRALRALGYVQ